MQELESALREQYLRHYSRGNLVMDPRQISPIIWRQLDLTYGPLLEGLPSGSRILDLGCGAGFLLYWLSRRPALAVAGIDHSPSQLRAARELLPALELEEGDGLEYLGRQRESFDGIFCLDVLEHLPATELCYQWLLAARQALRPGGFFFCRVPNAANIAGGYLRYIDLTHYRSFTSKSLLQLLDAAGFDRPRIVPLREAHFRGKLRRALETMLHRALFRISLHGPEDQFSTLLCGVGFRD